VQVAATPRKSRKSARFVSFREDDGSFRFRLLAADGEQLLLSRLRRRQNGRRGEQALQSARPWMCAPRH
jgi:uncharacterized protein YegP (UPF0339 family)